MRIYLLDRNADKCMAWKKFFGTSAVIECADFMDFMYAHRDVDGVVSPANAFGMMDGGYDAAISAFFGYELMRDVQERILTEYLGIQPIATCLPVAVKGRFNDDGKQIYLLHTPVMTTPSTVTDPKLIFHAMRNTLMAAERLGLSSVVFPAWGGACGRVDGDVIAYYMWEGYRSIQSPPEDINWDLIENIHDILNRR